MPKTILMTLAVALLAVPALAAKPAKDISSPPVAAVQKLLDCRAIQAADARLACYDAGAGTLSAAIASKDIVVADRAQIRNARRSLFGLTLPSFNLFGNGDEADDKEDREAFAELNSTIASARRRGDRNWIIILEDGAKWVQTDSRDFIRDPDRGMKIRIRRAAMGSYLANVQGQTAVRVMRQN